MRMRRTVRTAWVQALRSDEYSQARGGLHVLAPDGRTAIGHCCLGVACELAIKAGVGVYKGAPEGTVGGTALYTPYGGQTSFPPTSVAAWMETDGSWQVRQLVDDVDGELETWVSLADENDSGSSFAEIADLIENDLDAADDIRDDLAVTS